ncbi:hypothetical protein EC973_000901 [Apophysomyces ossiformis]|uniref:C2H2-type domain-containing protein n=1 Tax=Apophysomyces ossiformis TaxID=679940 RepID=A0A8H7BQR9_9FUNG|nr:hypothetical protein EC973_000901 [Apophysomyces ossiformis]
MATVFTKDMADGDWQTVTAKGGSSTHARRHSKQKGPFPPNKARSSTAKEVKSSVRTLTKESESKPKSVTASEVQHENPYHLPDDDDTEEDEEEDDRSDPIDLPVPPYHTTIVISCPFQSCPSMEPFLDTTSLVNHLRSVHHIVFKNLHHMYMALDAYLSRWATELVRKPLVEYGYEDVEENGVYIVDPDKCVLDKEIRDEMQREKLNEVLKTQQHERDYESKLSRKCLFCKIVNENRLQCLYCEKTFTSPAVLRKHMRKKKHFKIAAKNRQYDRFYVINYLEPGKNWENFEHDNYESDEERRDESWADWEEEEAEPTMCLFDDHVFPSPKEALEHMKESHGFDLSAVRREKDLDFYKVIVLINYIRHQSSLCKCFSCGESAEDLLLLAAHMQQKNCIRNFVSADADFWKDPRYLLPTYENDPLLTGFDDDGSDIEADLQLSDDEANRKFLSMVISTSLEQADGVKIREINQKDQL